MSRQLNRAMGYVDIHAHLLPVQDGPKSLGEAMKAIRLASESGIEHMILTPHYFSNDIRYKKTAILEVFERLKKEIKSVNIPIHIYLGNELNVEKRVIESLKNKDALPLANSRYVLAEYPFYQVPCNYVNIIDELFSLGYLPIIAHPERNAFIQSGYENVVALKNMGCLIQLNAASFLGDYGRLANRYAQRILKEGMADFIASDAHSYVRRPPDVILRCINKLQKLCDKSVLENLLKTRAKEIILSENNGEKQEID